MPLTAIICCRPMSEQDIFLTHIREKSLFLACANFFLKQKRVDRMVLALPREVPKSIVSRLRRDGFEVLIGGREMPQQRILRAMEQLNLSEALVLNGYSFLVDTDIIDLLVKHRTEGYNLLAYVSKSPFSYAALISLEACREIAVADASPLPPNRLHCYQRRPGSLIKSRILRAKAKFSPLDDCFWLLALNVLHGGSDTLLALMLDKVRQDTPPLQALSNVLSDHDINIPALIKKYGSKSVHHYFKYRREVEYTWLKQLTGIKNQNRTFMEIGYGCSPYPSRLFSRHFDRGLCFDPYESTNSPLFLNQLSIAKELDKKLKPYLTLRGHPPCKIQYSQCSLHELNLPPASVDFCYSSSVMEHVQDLEAMAIELKRIMRPGSIMLHAVDFTAHSERSDDDIYPFYSHAKDWWFANKPWCINLLRVPDVSDVFTRAGFNVKVLQRNVDSRVPAELHSDWQSYSPEVLICAGAFFQCTIRT